MKTDCPECEYTPDIDKEAWVKLLITHIVNVHGWTLGDAEYYVEGRPYREDYA